MPATEAAWWLSATAAMGMLGKLGFGAILDRFDQRAVAAVCFALQAAGLAILWLGTGAVALVAYVVLYGYAMGGNATLQASLIGEMFGRLHYGAISARMMPVIVLSQAAVIPAMGYVRDQTGSYAPAFMAIIVASLVSAVLVLRLRPPIPSHT